MFGRLSYASGDAARIDDLITYVRTVVKPATDELPGNLGLGMWVNRDTGNALVMTVWADETTLRASEDAVVKLRDDAAGVIGGNASVERFENVLIDATEPHQIGNIMRLIRMQCRPGQIEANIGWARESVLPIARSLEGYLSYVVSVDRATGGIASMTTFRDVAVATAAMDRMAPVRDAAERRGIAIEAINDYEVAIVGIRAPLPNTPMQRTVDVTEAKQPIG